MKASSCLCTPTMLLMAAIVAQAGGPLKVAGVSGFNAGLAGTPLLWFQGTVRYYTDLGDLSPVLPQASANAFVADAFTRWTSISTAAIAAVNSGSLAEDVNGTNVTGGPSGVITMPADIQPTAVGTPVGVVYDADGAVTDAFLGSGASSLCSVNAVFGGPDNFSLDAHISHALLVLNGKCARTTADLTYMKYQLVRVIGRVLGLDWADLNENVVNGVPTLDDELGFPLMHAIEPTCIAVPAPCTAFPDQPKLEDISALSRLYPVTTSNIGNFSGKILFASTTARIAGSVYFTNNGSRAQPMQGVKVVARWIDPATGVPSQRYVASSVSGFLFRGNAGNPVSGFVRPSGERYDHFGSNASTLEGFFDLAGLPFPDGTNTAGYQITTESVDPLCTLLSGVHPYADGQVALSGASTAWTVTVVPGDNISHDILMAGSAAPVPDVITSFGNPAKVPPAGDWAGSLSGYGNVDYYSFAARANRTMLVRVTATDETRLATEHKAQPVLGLWASTDLPGKPPQAFANYFSSGVTGETSLNALFETDGIFKLGIADNRGDGRPDFPYHANIFYGDTVSPLRVGVQGGTALSIRGISFQPGMAVAVGASIAPVVQQTPNFAVAIAPPLSDGVQDLTLWAPDGSSVQMLKAVSYGTISSDKIVLLQGSNPGTPVGGVSVNPFRVRVLQQDLLTPVAGATVKFSATPPTLLFSPCGASACSLVTDGQGEVTTPMLVTAAGATTVMAALPSGAFVQGTLVGTSSGLDISLLAPRAWLSQAATVNLPLTARVLSNGSGISNRKVNYAILLGNASLSASSAITDTDGFATTTLKITALSSEIDVSACVAPAGAPCQKFVIFAVPVSAQRLQATAGDRQFINIGQTFAPVTVRVTDSSSPPNPVGGAPVSFLGVVFRWAPTPPPGSLPPKPVVLNSWQLNLTTDRSGSVRVLPAPATSYGAVTLKVTATSGSNAQQFELQRLWPVPTPNFAGGRLNPR